MHDDSPITIRKLPGVEAWGAWGWRCSNGYCLQRRRIGFGSQQAALRAACRHLAATFDTHHGMVEVSPHWSEEAQRATATCRCGHEVEEKTEQGAEDSLYSHIDWLRRDLPSAARHAA